MISSGFNKLSAISVRDKNSQEIVELFSNKHASLVCDPVILYGYKKEIEQFKPSMKDYIIIYSYDKNMNSLDEIEIIKNYAQNSHLKIVSVGYYHKWCKNVQADPEQLLGWIKNARLVVTDTFHGAVMSIICNTPMVVKLRGNQNKLNFLLEEYGLSSQIVKDFSEIEKVAEQQIDFDAVNVLVKEHRKKSMEFLQNIF